MTTVPPTKTAAIGLLTETVVLEKCDYLLDVQLWPTKGILNPERWLENFNPTEREFALYLLNAFQFYSEDLTNHLFIAAIDGIGRHVTSQEKSMKVRAGRWDTFLTQALFTYVEGETPNPADSGYAFARRARQLIGIPEANIVTPDNAIREVLSSPGRPVVFVDDFVGSGDQFCGTWFRQRELSQNRKTAFSDVQKAVEAKFYYAPLVCTADGAYNIRTSCTGLELLPVHVLTQRDSLLHPQCPYWPPHLAPHAHSFIQDVSARAGISDWKGYSDLGLSIAFHHSTPDACLPLYYWNKNGWRPLVNRA
jgi:hypothetical protein